MYLYYEYEVSPPTDSGCLLKGSFLTKVYFIIWSTMYIYATLCNVSAVTIYCAWLYIIHSCLSLILIYHQYLHITYSYISPISPILVYY